MKKENLESQLKVILEGCGFQKFSTCRHCQYKRLDSVSNKCYCEKIFNYFKNNDCSQDECLGLSYIELHNHCDNFKEA